MIDQHMEVMEAAKAAFEVCGVAPKVQSIRGGTNGARLSFAGLPCPNLSTGGANFHSRYECIPVEDMECMVDVFIHLVNIDRDLLLIPHMAIHMDRLMNTCKGTSALAQLALHSPYETGGNQDPLHLLNVMKALYSTEILCTQDGEYPVL